MAVVTRGIITTSVEYKCPECGATNYGTWATMFPPKAYLICTTCDKVVKWSDDKPITYVNSVEHSDDSHKESKENVT